MGVSCLSSARSTSVWLPPVYCPPATGHAQRRASVVRARRASPRWIRPGIPGNGVSTRRAPFGPRVRNLRPSPLRKDANVLRPLVRSRPRGVHPAKLSSYSAGRATLSSRGRQLNEGAGPRRRCYFSFWPNVLM